MTASDWIYIGGITFGILGAFLTGFPEVGVALAERIGIAVGKETVRRIGTGLVMGGGAAVGSTMGPFRKLWANIVYYVKKAWNAPPPSEPEYSDEVKAMFIMTGGG